MLLIANNKLNNMDEQYFPDKYEIFKDENTKLK